MKRILFIVLLGACMVSCTRTSKTTENQAHLVPLAKYMDLEHLEKLCYSDTLHNKALFFSSPYCSGCQHKFKEQILPAMEEVDTSLWRFYYLIVVEDADTLKYNQLMADCLNMGIDTNNAYIWKLDWTKEDYNKVFSRFRSTHSLENSVQGIPWTIMLDKKNYISNQRMCYVDQRDSFWYEPRGFDKTSIQIEDFSVDDPEWYLMVSR